MNQALAEFHAYVKSFYGPGGLYDMAATDAQISMAIGFYLCQLTNITLDLYWGDGDSVDRERVRDILIDQFKLVFP